MVKSLKANGTDCVTEEKALFDKTLVSSHNSEDVSVFNMLPLSILNVCALLVSHPYGCIIWPDISIFKC